MVAPRPSPDLPTCPSPRVGQRRDFLVQTWRCSFPLQVPPARSLAKPRRSGLENNLANALRTLGERESGPAHLTEAVAAYRAALEERTRDRVPLQWAMTQNNLGNALLTLGRRESGAARLQAAVAAYRAALEERTRDRVPLDWAMTQNNLANALATLGERESGAARLEEAIVAFDACLTVTETAWPEEWVQQVRSHRDETRAEITRRRATK